MARDYHRSFGNVLNSYMPLLLSSSDVTQLAMSFSNNEPLAESTHHPAIHPLDDTNLSIANNPHTVAVNTLTKRHPAVAQCCPRRLVHPPESRNHGASTANPAYPVAKTIPAPHLFALPTDPTGLVAKIRRHRTDTSLDRRRKEADPASDIVHSSVETTTPFRRRFGLEIPCRIDHPSSCA